MIDFPANPVNGQTFTAAGVNWTYDGAKWTASGLSANYLPIAGGTMTGTLTLAGNPVGNLDATPKQYVDDVIAGDNRIINGDMRIDQRNNGASGTATGYTIDRWQYSASVASKGAWQRLGGPTSLGFPYCLNFTSSSAYAVAAGDYFSFTQAIEADMVSDFAYGTTLAQPVTLSFWVFSTLSGTFGGCMRNAPVTRTYPFTYSIPAANTWTKITITIPGDTTGTWVMSGSAIGISLNFGLGVGSTYSAPAGAWVSGNYLSANGAVSVVGTNAAQFLVTGVKLEVGNVATPFNRQSLAKSLADCQRYYERSYDLGTATGANTTNGYSLTYMTGLTSIANSASGLVRFNASKRAPPTVIMYSASVTGAAGKVRDNVSSVDITPTIAGPGVSGFSWYAAMSAAGTSVNMSGHWTAEAEL